MHKQLDPPEKDLCQAIVWHDSAKLFESMNHHVNFCGHQQNFWRPMKKESWKVKIESWKVNISKYFGCPKTSANVVDVQKNFGCPRIFGHPKENWMFKTKFQIDWSWGKGWSERPPRHPMTPVRRSSNPRKEKFIQLAAIQEEVNQSYQMSQYVFHPSWTIHTSTVFGGDLGQSHEWCLKQ